MGKEINLILLLLCSIFLVQLASSESIGNFPILGSVEIYQECNNCTYCNFTRVMFPNGSKIINNTVASIDRTHYYYTLKGSNFTKRGVHTYCYDCGNSVTKDTGCLNFNIGPTLTNSEAIIYITLLVFFIMFFIFLLILLKNIPPNQVNEQNYIEVVSMKWAFRPILFGLCLGLGVGILFVCSNIAVVYLEDGMLGKILFFLFRLSLIFCSIAIPITLVLTFLNVLKTIELKNLVDRGVLVMP